MASSGPELPVDADRHSFSAAIENWRGWWHREVIASVDQVEVINERRQDSDLSPRYLFMSAMSAGIAVLGLLLSSPAVVIGAMLLSPLMGPIIGLGFALATGDYLWIRQASRSLLYGVVLSIILCAFIVLVSPLQTITPEIASRTRPNLFDLGVALFSALAGAYAMIRGREGTIVGVAIATALMPPLAVVGFGLATLNWTVFSGSLLLFFTNLMTIALTAALMARLYGFSTRLSKKQTHLQTALIVTAFVALAIPLGLALFGVAKEAAATRQVNSALLEPFPDRALVSDFDLDLNGDPAKVSAVVLTPEIKAGISKQLEQELTAVLGRPVELTLTQVPVGNSAQAAELAQLERSRDAEAAARERADDLAERLALIAGVSSDDVLVDRQRRVATVTGGQCQREGCGEDQGIQRWRQAHWHRWISTGCTPASSPFQAHP